MEKRDSVLFSWRQLAIISSIYDWSYYGSDYPWCSSCGISNYRISSIRKQRNPADVRNHCKKHCSCIFVGNFNHPTLYLEHVYSELRLVSYLVLHWVDEDPYRSYYATFIRKLLPNHLLVDYPNEREEIFQSSKEPSMQLLEVVLRARKELQNRHCMRKIGSFI